MEILFCTGEKKGGWEGSRMATDGDGVDIMSSESKNSGMEDAGEIDNDQNTGKVECGKEINAVEIDNDVIVH